MELTGDRRGSVPTSADRVALVGLGGCTSLGTSWASTRENLWRGKVGTTAIELFDLATRIGRVPIEPSNQVPRFHQLSVVALQDLLESIPDLPGDPLGVVAATSKGELGSFTERSISGLGNPGVWADRIASCFPRVRHISGPNAACATGLSALISAARWIADGEVSHAVVVASESSFHPLLLAGYRNLDVLCGARGMRPFHPDRDGFALAEGAAAVYLVHPERISDLEPQPVGWIRGWAETCDAHHMTRVDADGGGLNRALKQAVERAGLLPDQINLLHAHLTTTPANDELERSILERWPPDPLLQGVKPALGHTLGAAGLIEAMATLETLRRDRPFPLATARTDHLPDGLATPEKTPPPNARFGLTWNMGFGGHNAAVVLEEEG